MKLTSKYILPMIFAGLVITMGLVGPAASIDGPITLRVPVELKKMIADSVRVSCTIWGDDTGQGAHLGHESQIFQIENGEFDQVVELVVKQAAGKNFSAAKSYRCVFDVQNSDYSLYHYTPEQGPPAQKAWMMAKPGEFFRSEVTGQLSGVALGGGPKSLQIK